VTRSLLLTLAPWAGAVVAAGVVGAVVGVSGLVGHPEKHVTVVAGNTSLAREVAAASCPGGPIVTAIQAGTRVLALARNADSTSVGVRDPHDTGNTIWLRASDVTLDPDSASVTTLEVESCPVVYRTEQVAPTPPAPTPSASTSAAPHAGDSTKPAIASASANPTLIYQHGSGDVEKSTVSAAATDNVAVTKITATWPSVGPVPAGSAQITGGSGSFVFGPFGFPLDATDSYEVPITLIAHDAAGNASAPVVVKVTVEFKPA
jgi:hypothetical protein